MAFRVQKQDYLAHIGTPMHSGRYPWGSGANPQRSKDISAFVKQLEDDGFTQKQIAEALGFKHTSEVRDLKTVLLAKNRAADAAMAQRLLDKGMSKSAIGRRMGKNESTIRALLDPGLQAKNQILLSTMDMLRSAADKNYIDVGLGTESTLGLNRTKLNAAVTGLRLEGYEVMYVRTLQVGTGKYTSLKVLVPPGTKYTDVSQHTEKITELSFGSKDRGITYDAPKPPVSVSSSRILVRYREDGGADKDGLIELRRGPADISLGASNYAQVRIAVEGTHYLKGMAVHTDTIPPGYDIVFNTGKNKGANKLAAMKPMKTDKDGNVDMKNPFGALIKANGQRGALNIVNEQGDWVAWSNTLSSQVLSKQSPQLARAQLGEFLKAKQAAFDEISSVTNPVLKSMFMRTFADECDSATVDLKGASLPRQANHVLIPITSLKPNEIYAPSRYNNGEEVVVIRHPHGGIFEIAKLVVNNKNPEAQKVIGNARDAVGIHPNVAKKLSGADFDGDTGIVVPVPRNEIRVAPSLKALQDFDTKIAYPPYHGMKTIDGGNWDATTNKVDYGGKKPKRESMQIQMGLVSNLITDMTVKGAPFNEIAQAVRHSMVIIDSEKHSLNYAQSYNDNGIKALKTKYQGGPRAGASTLLSRASSEQRIPERKTHYKIDTVTGEKVYQVTGSSFVSKSGKTIVKTDKIAAIEKEKNAHKLSSGTQIEGIYADHANGLKSLANRARLVVSQTEMPKSNPQAKKIYAKEVAKMEADLALAYRNKPLERQAQLLANRIVDHKKEQYDDLSKADLKKIKGMALTEARLIVGAKKHPVEIDDRQWEAIQMGAITTNTLTKILLNTDQDALKARALPKTSIAIPESKLLRAKTMLQTGRTRAEIANALGVSVSALDKALSE